MLNKFAIDYTLHPHQHNRILTHRTDDPVEAEDFLMHLLTSRARIKEIRHEGVALNDSQLTRMLKVSTERLVSRMLEESLGLDMVEVRDRFGLAA